MDDPEPKEHAADRDCAAALQELYTFLDGELTTTRRTTIRQHLDQCNNCLEAFDFEAELRIVISTRCRDAVPDGLRSRVFRALREQVADDA